MLPLPELMMACIAIGAEPTGSWIKMPGGWQVLPFGSPISTATTSLVSYSTCYSAWFLVSRNTELENTGNRGARCDTVRSER